MIPPAGRFLGLQRIGRHPPGLLTDDLIDQRRCLLDEVGSERRGVLQVGGAVLPRLRP
jgi:hypothetical protein